MGAPPSCTWFCIRDSTQRPPPSHNRVSRNDRRHPPCRRRVPRLCNHRYKRSLHCQIHPCLNRCFGWKCHRERGRKRPLPLARPWIRWPWGCWLKPLVRKLRELQLRPSCGPCRPFVGREGRFPTMILVNFVWMPRKTFTLWMTDRACIRASSAVSGRSVRTLSSTRCTFYDIV